MLHERRLLISLLWQLIALVTLTLQTKPLNTLYYYSNDSIHFSATVALCLHFSQTMMLNF